MTAAARLPVAPWRIGVDIGGTFTDLVLNDAEGVLHVAKVPSTPDVPARGVVDGLERMASGLAMSARDLLAGCALFVHGSTIATNTMLEGKGAKVAMVTTEGFRDGLARLRTLGESRRCAIMCAETVWWRCHRRIIADYLLAAGETVFHIMGPGKIEPAHPTESATKVADGVLTYPVPA